MIIENKKKSQKIKLIFLSIPLIIAITVIVFVLLNIDWGVLVIAPVAAVGVIIYVFMYAMKYSYINAEIDPQKIFIRFYQITPFFTEYKAYRIQPDQLISYSIKSSFMGLVPNLILTVRTKSGKGLYPPISLSALTKEQIAQIEKALTLLIAINK